MFVSPDTQSNNCHNSVSQHRQYRCRTKRELCLVNVTDVIRVRDDEMPADLDAEREDSSEHEERTTPPSIATVQQTDAEQWSDENDAGNNHQLHWSQSHRY